ncbi:MAG: hypothetical protein SGBAC_008658 [Bacillariaceae sp.]
MDIVPVQAFHHCQKLVDVSFPPTLTKLERNAFQHCVLLQRVKLPPPTVTIGIRCFDGCHKLVVADLSGCAVCVLMKQCFRNCKSLQLVRLPKALGVIARDAFRGCQSLTRLGMQDTQLRIIGKRALSNCKSLQRVELPPSTKQVGQLAFAGCTALTEAEVPISLNIDYDSDIFKDCPRLEIVVVFPEAIRTPEINAGLPFRTRSDPRRDSLPEEAAPNALQEQASHFTRVLDEAKQENVALTQRLESVCEKLEKYESQWSTMVDHLKFSMLGATDDHQQKEENEMQQAKEKQLEVYKGIVESQRKRIWEMKRAHFDAMLAATRSSSSDQQNDQDFVSGDQAALTTELRRLNLSWSQQAMESESTLRTNHQDEAVGKVRAGTASIPFRSDQDTFSLDSADLIMDRGGPIALMPFLAHPVNDSVDYTNLVITQPAGSEDSNEWQVM